MFLHGCANVIWSLKWSEVFHFFFYLGYFASSKSFNHITKDASVLHKLSW
jgi:hypothetical protein